MEQKKTNTLHELLLPTFISGVKDCVPTLVGYIGIGLAAGVVGSASSLSVLEVTLLSALVYAGASQFIICALLVTQTPALAIIATTFIVNLRHLLLSMTIAPFFTKHLTTKNIGFGILLTDETFGVASTKLANKEPINDKWLNGLNLTAYASWILSCSAGAVFGRWIQNPEQYGLDFALTAMFVALLVLQLQAQASHKLKLYFTLIVVVVLLMLMLSQLMPTYIATLLSTIIGATIGVLKDK